MKTGCRSLDRTFPTLFSRDSEHSEEAPVPFNSESVNRCREAKGAGRESATLSARCACSEARPGQVAPTFQSADQASGAEPGPEAQGGAAPPAAPPSGSRGLGLAGWVARCGDLSPVTPCVAPLGLGETLGRIPPKGQWRNSPGFGLLKLGELRTGISRLVSASFSCTRLAPLVFNPPRVPATSRHV